MIHEIYASTRFESPLDETIKRKHNSVFYYKISKTLNSLINY